MFTRLCARESRKGFDFALSIHAISLPPMKKPRNQTATAAMSIPRAAPNTKPSVLSSGPMRLSMIMSATRMVMNVTMIRTTRKMMPPEMS